MQIIRIKNNFFFSNFHEFKNLTGVAGFEPANGGVKVHSLTAWRHPRSTELEKKL